MMKLKISPYIFVIFAAMLLMLPFNWLIAAAIAAIFHELCHILCVYVLGGKVDQIYIGSRGAVMDAQALSPARQLVCTLAGPCGSLLLLLGARWFPRTAICGLIQGLFNLLPLFPLDGGRILQSLLFAILPPPQASKAFYRFQRVIHYLLLMLAVIATLQFGSFLLIPVFFLLPRIIFGGTIGAITDKRYFYDRIAGTNPAHRAETCSVHRRRI